MILKKTCFVLGAGASLPHGFQSGPALLNEVIYKLNPQEQKEDPQPERLSNWYLHMARFDFKTEDVWKFRKSLSLSGCSSVDAFLEHRPEFLEIGKLAIALALIPKENENDLFDTARLNGTWYHYIYNQMNTKFNEIGDNSVSFITFNYDRSLEYYFMTAMMNTHNRSIHDCAGQLERIPIIHVHGNLGDLPWQGSKSRPYENIARYEQLDIARQKIIVLSEADGTSPEFTLAHSLLDEAQQIIFLGFGYHEVNLDRLMISAYKKNRLILGTYKGVGEARKREIRDKYGIGFTDKGAEIDSILANAVTLHV